MFSEALGLDSLTAGNADVGLGEFVTGKNGQVLDAGVTGEKFMLDFEEVTGSPFLACSEAVTIRFIQVFTKDGTGHYLGTQVIINPLSFFGRGRPGGEG